ncbi:DUF1918 domain-containing protein [Streptomyces cinerochromogenes]|uniref:DUF1918 domain-containing protein n=1 Tax=Streptomyces cinerochromogenes TaxID=66422 RepID=UPI0033B0D960
MSVPAPPKKNDQAVPTAGPEAAGTSARAREIVVRETTAGVVARDGLTVGLHHPDGSPPHDVRRADSGRVTFPGPDACIRHLVTGGDHVPAR